MAVLMITYDLNTPGQNYQAIYDYIKENYTWCKGMESVWLVDTTTLPSAIRDDLIAICDENDKIFVVKITKQWASLGYYCADWLNDSARNW
ncbi:hypothetical protein [Parasphingorhabdus sp. NYA22]